jgi:mannitol/fructose-specific phosphotransferase system IIA component (Ntr-type)
MGRKHHAASTMPQAVSTRKLALPHARSAAAIAPTTPLMTVDAAIDQDNGADEAGDLVAVLGATV